ncbi:MAG: hypothetical protein AAFU79_25875 [Myxococcota bacterium]
MEVVLQDWVFLESEGLAPKRPLSQMRDMFSRWLAEEYDWPGVVRETMVADPEGCWTAERVGDIFGRFKELEPSPQ